MKLIQSFLLIGIVFSTTFGETPQLSLPDDIKPFFVYRSIQRLLPNDQNSGFYCYAIPKLNTFGPYVEIYIVEDGKVTEMVSQGSNGRNLMKRIRSIGLSNFDYQKEVEESKIRVIEAYGEEGKTYHPRSYTIADGSICEITYSLDGTKFTCQDYEPVYTIEELSKYSENIGKLHAVYLELIRYYAERKMHTK